MNQRLNRQLPTNWPPPSLSRSRPQVKVFQQSTGFCFATFTEHTAPVTALAFLPSGAALLSASLDGTVRAWDLVRYRNFRTLTSPTPAQYGSLAVDPAGEVVVAGAVDTFQVGVGWCGCVLEKLSRQMSVRQSVCVFE